MFSAVRSTAAAILMVAALSGCSLIAAPHQAPPTADPTPSETVEAASQTAKDACNLLRPALIDMSGRMSAAYAELQKSDAQKASSLLHGISDDMHATLDEITNAEVLGVTSTAVDSLDRFTAEIDKVIAGNPDQDALLAASKDVNDDFSAIDPVCEAATK